MRGSATWQGQLEAAGPHDHIAQLYTDDGFLGAAVGIFAGTGLARGEAVALIATPAHLELFAEHIAGARAATARGQLVLVNATAVLDRLIVDGLPDRARFMEFATGLLDRLRGRGVRVYGELVNLLWETNVTAALRIEELWNQLLADRPVPLFCGYRIDNFDPHLQRDVLSRIGPQHSHLIPVADYERLEVAVDQAYADVFGELGEPRALRRVLSASVSGRPAMPPAQAALLALRGVYGRAADAVLERAGHYYRNYAGPPPGPTP
jgi:hypothetical protein